MGLGVVLVLLVLVAALWSRLLESVIFQPSSGAAWTPAQAGAVAEDVFLETADGTRVHAYWLPADGATRAVLFLHGNAGNASHRLPNAAANG